MMQISVRSNLKQIQRKLNSFAFKQVPYAVARGLTDVAYDVKAAQVEAFPHVLDRPTPFTVNAISVIPARKDRWTAVVFVKDKTARYLEPYERGGVNLLNSRGLLKPKNVTLNQYGNLARSLLKRLKGRNRVFIGAVKAKGGEVRGVWQRIPARRGRPASLKLLIRFTDPHPTRAILGYRARAQRVVGARWNKRFGAAMGRAIATAR